MDEVADDRDRGAVLCGIRTGSCCCGVSARLRVGASIQSRRLPPARRHILAQRAHLIRRPDREVPMVRRTPLGDDRQDLDELVPTGEAARCLVAPSARVAVDGNREGIAHPRCASASRFVRRAGVRTRSPVGLLSSTVSALRDGRFARYPLTTRTGQPAWRRTFSVTLPSHILSNPLRPWVPMTIRSMPFLAAYSVIWSAGGPRPT